MSETKTTHANSIHRAKTWEIAFYALNNTSTNLYMMAFMYVSYFLTGIVGVGVVLAGTITTVMRMWDGVTDPFIGYIVDKTNTKFGKNRPFILIGNLILLVTSFLLMGNAGNSESNEISVLCCNVHAVYYRIYLSVCCNKICTDLFDKRSETETDLYNV